MNKWNEVVGKDDIVWHLGDFALCKSEEIQIIFNRLNGIKNLITGNHDKSKTNTYWKNVGFKEVYRKEHDMGDFIFSHIPNRKS